MMRTIAPAGYEATVRKRPMTLHEFRGEDVLNMKARGFLELCAALGSGATTFVNVLSTDSSVMSGLNGETKSGRTVLSLGERRYRIDTSAGNRVGTPVTEGDVVTDALVYSKTPNGHIAMRVTKLEVGGQTLFTADKPICIAIQEGAVLTLDYSAHEEMKLALRLLGRPKLVFLDGQDHRNWSYSPETGLVIEIPAGRGVLGIR